MGRHASRWIPPFVLAWAVLFAPGCLTSGVARTPGGAAQREVARPVPATSSAGMPAARTEPVGATTSVAAMAHEEGMTAAAAGHPGMMMRHRGMHMMAHGAGMGGCARMRGMAGMQGMMAAGAAEPAADVVLADCPAVTPELAATGRKVFVGKGNCATCHGMDAKGTPLAPNLVQHQWLNVDGSYAAISGLVQRGVPQPKQHPAPMPPMGGASLSSGEICAVAAYVYLLSHKQ